jgi:cytochrome d ubiquinol oxidase subunit I
MDPTLASVFLARLQFGVAASYHFLFVPLTLGMAWILFAMEILYVATGKEVYKDMTRFWGKLFGINFALGVLTGLTLEFQFGTNWAYYSQYVGDIFGTPLAIEGLVAFMLESTFLGAFFFGWNKFSKYQHLFATFCLAFGSSLSALLILVANGYMQHPVGSGFNFETVRMETQSLYALFMNPFAQLGFVHTVIAGFVTGAVFVLGISSYYLLKKRDVDFAKRSFAVASGFGLVSCLLLIFVGDGLGVLVAKEQPMKLAAIEAEWTTQKAPASFNLIAFPSQSDHKNFAEIQIPEILGLIVTHSKNAVIPGINDIEVANENRIQEGMKAYGALVKLREGDQSASDLFRQTQGDLGYGLLLKKYTDKVVDATPAQIHAAAEDSIPSVFAIFWAFRIMVGLGFLMLFGFLYAFVQTLRNKNIWNQRWFLRAALYGIPVPWIACLVGWFVTEHGRQPWTIFGVLPTNISSSSISSVDIGISFLFFVLFYTGLFIVEIYLMFKYARLGPSSLGTGKYDQEMQIDKLSK